MTNGTARRLGDWHARHLGQQLCGAGLLLDLGSVSLAVRSDAPDLAADLVRTYCHFPASFAVDYADVWLDLKHHRRWLKPWAPQVRLFCDAAQPFEPFPADAALPMMEWGTNWLIGQRTNHLLLLHAGCVARDGLALLMPAIPGSGKSTLTAALAHSGWRLLSDEFGACDPETGRVQAVLKPIALKNASIAVIRDRFASAVIGRTFVGTRKGDVAHVAAPAAAVAARHEAATPAAVLLPRWVPGSPTRLEPIADDELFRALAFNAFNYAVLGETGFRTAVALVRSCVGWRLEYSDLDDALLQLEHWWHEQVLPPARRQKPWEQLT